jgi:hypothetical protein
MKTFKFAFTFKNLNSELNSKCRASAEKNMIALEKDHLFKQSDGCNIFSPRQTNVLGKTKNIIPSINTPNSISFKLMPKLSSQKNEKGDELLKKKKADN